MHATTPLVGIAVLALAAALYPHDSSRSAAPSPLPEPVHENSCKPTGPLDLRFLETRDFGDGTVELELTIYARLALSELDWRLDMPFDVALVEGRRSGRLALDRGAETSERMRVRLSSLTDGRAVTAVVRGVFQGSDSAGNVFPEPVEVQRTIRWGETPPVAPVVTYVDPATGEEVRMVDLPSVRTGTTSTPESRERRSSR